MNKHLLFAFILGLFQTFSAQSQCNDTLPANTVIITSDTTLSNVNGSVNYLICPGVEVDFTGNMSTMVHYYMEEGSIVNIGTYHYPTFHMQSTSQVNANHSTATPMPSYILNSVAEYGAIFVDTLDQYTVNIDWCSNLIFNYSNLPGGVGCPAAPCVEILPANTIVITSDTTLSTVNGAANYLICPGVEVDFTGNMSSLVNYYMEEGAILNIGNYHYPTLYMQSSAQVNANHSTATPMPSYIFNSVAEYGAIFVDTLDQYTNNITWCSNLIFDYSNLPGGVGCPAAPCVEILPANTIVITSDTTLSTVNGAANYLICPGVEVDFTGNMSTLVNYYMEEGAILNIGNYHYPTLYMQSSAQVNANHSTATPMPSYIFNSVAEYGAIFMDTLDQYTGNIEWCSNLIFDYSNLPGGVGCPTMTSVKNILSLVNIKIYPNPTERFVQIELKDFNKYHVHITNSLGQTVLNQKITQENSNLDMLDFGGKGIYFLFILNEKNEIIRTEKIVNN